jgi:hypothetical protein
MSKPDGAPRRRRRGATPLRDLLCAHWDHRMERWRIEGHLYPYEIALKSGGDVVVSSGRLADALRHAGQATDRFEDDGADAGKVWLLGDDDSLTEIRDEHVAAMDQRDFDALVDGTGPLRRRAGDVKDPHAGVVQHAAWTAAIRAAMD